MADQVVQKVIIRMADITGKTGTSSVQIPTDAGSDPIPSVAGYVTVLEAISNAKVVGQVGQTADNDEVGTVDANVYDVRDKLTVEYVGSQNDHHLMTVGDLDPAILDATNKETVDETNGDWLVLKGAIEANVIDKSGGGVTVIRGFRTRSQKLKTTMKFQ
jgi:hypothetical protein